SITLHQRYIYRGYLQLACCDLTRTGHPCLWLLTWDPTQPVATRPLAIRKDGTWYAYGWDLTKNICEIFGQHGYLRTAYSYSPYGEVTADGDVTQPIQWSSEYNDTETALVYYNYRHYNPVDGRWLGRDMLGEEENPLLYSYSNSPTYITDLLGLAKNLGELQDYVKHLNELLSEINNCYNSCSHVNCEKMHDAYIVKLKELKILASEFYAEQWWISSDDKQLMSAVNELPHMINGSITPKQLDIIAEAQKESASTLSKASNIKHRNILNGIADVLAGFSDSVLWGYGEKLSKTIYGNQLAWPTEQGGSVWYETGTALGYIADGVSFKRIGKGIYGVGKSIYNGGREIKISKNLRIAPVGNRTGHKYGELPHYHRRGIDKSGASIQGQGIGRHRPWEAKATDKSFLDRF
ncbi:MAG: RHS repeat-associated core domain-containing protein, partial [Clostridia bacterium]|nr:RHS repeat-associated core domain-containing protein [Clostridia bacterium]